MKIARVPVVHKGRDYLVADITSKILGFSPKKVWCSSPSVLHRTSPYPVPKSIRMGIRGSDEAGAKFTPPPFAVVVENGAKEKERVLVTVKAHRGWHVWNFIEFKTTCRGTKVIIDLEGHTSVGPAKEHVSVFILKAREGESNMSLVARGLKRLYPSAYRPSVSKIPAWWYKPIYCGYGDQVATSLVLEGPGFEPRSMGYCIQGLYERWTDRLDKAGVPFGTVIIDAGWSQSGIWKPFSIQWPDLRGFIERQHDKGRRVLLWIATWFYEGLPDSWCLFSGKKRLSVDPANTQYRSFLKEQVYRLLSPDKGCYNADGFKIDQLAYVPTERRPRWGRIFGKGGMIKDHKPMIKNRGEKWGLELLYMLQKDIYRAAKAAKSDALVTSSTVHPYFHDTFDMVRLHDTGNVKTDVFCAMKARADLSKAALVHKPIDTDDWIHKDYKQWLSYTMNSYQLGVPCIFYSEKFVLDRFKKPVTTRIPLKDLRRIAKSWYDNVEALK